MPISRKASAASALGRMVRGLLVITSPTRWLSRLLPIWRRKSPSVTIPISAPW